MNRVTVIMVALALLLAHALAIHQNSAGGFAPPYEYAYVAFRLARNLVHHDSIQWITGGVAVESYPSLLWIGVAAVAERLYLSPIVVGQTLGVVCVLLTIVIVAQFSPRRLAGLVAPLLLAASGSAAAAATSGTEAPLAMLLLTGAFLAFERRWRLALALCLGLAVVARPEAALFAGGLFSIETRRARAHKPPRDLRRAFLATLAVFLLAFAFRRLVTGRWSSPFLTHALGFEDGTWSLGWRYLWSFWAQSGTGCLIALPLALAALFKLSSLGRRALALSGLWFLAVASSGGDGLPFWNALAPILPLFFLSIQESFRNVIDARPALAPALSGVFLLGVLACFVVSKAPGDLGPIPLGRLQRAWLDPGEQLTNAFQRPLGRAGLAIEIFEVERLRTLAVFLRDSVDEPSTVLSIWPGAVGYISRKRIFDLLGRAYPAAGRSETASWRGSARVDLVAALESGADYIVPAIDPMAQGITPAVLLRELLRRYDEVGDTEGRLGQLFGAIRHYEMIAVPVPAQAHRPGQPSPSPFLLMRRKDLTLTPQLKIESDGLSFAVVAHHGGHHQVVDLEVWFVDDEDTRWTLEPTGRFVRKRVGAARTDVLLYPTGQRPIHVIEGRLPEGVEQVELWARFMNPGLVGERSLGATSHPVSKRIGLPGH